MIGKFLLGSIEYFFPYKRLCLHAKASFIPTKLLQFNGIIFLYGHLNAYHN